MNGCEVVSAQPPALTSSVSIHINSTLSSSARRPEVAAIIRTTIPETVSSMLRG